MPSRQAVTALWLCVMLAGCGVDEDAYFPLDGSHRWLYHVELTTMDGTSELRYVVDNLPPGDLNGETLARRRTVDGRIGYYRRSDDGIELVARTRPDVEQQMELLDPPIMVLPARLAPGEAWQQPTLTAALQNTGPPWETLFRIVKPVRMEYRVVARDETVVVPAGRFSDCLHVEGHGSANADVGNYIGRTFIEVHTDDWYAPGVGLVRSERTETTRAEALSHGAITMELESLL